MSERTVLASRIWIWIALLASRGCLVDGVARGTRGMDWKNEGEWIDLDVDYQNDDYLYEEPLLAKKSRSRGGTMQMSLRRNNEDPVKPEDILDNSEEQIQAKTSTRGGGGGGGEGAGTEPSPRSCGGNSPGGPRSPFRGRDNAERLLLREGIINQIPSSRCGRKNGKNVILVIGDGMGWEMARAGAIARRVVDELEGMGCNTTTGCPDNHEAYAAFQGRTLANYYYRGKGSGLSFQELTGFALSTSTAALVQKPNKGNSTASPYSMLEGTVAKHENGMAPLALNECGHPLEFDPRDHIKDGGNMVLWDDVKGGKFPWDRRYRSLLMPSFQDGFDPLYIMQHATDSSAAATALATGHKVATSMQSVNLYEEEVSTIVEDAMRCDKAAGVVSSKPILHATPGTFVSHSNHRKHFDQIRRSFRQVNPTMASGTCGRKFYPFPEDLQSMRNGSLSRTWTFFEQKPTVMAENFYDGLENLDPDNGDHVLVCLGGDFTRSKKEELPYRGVDSSYSNRWCGQGTVVDDPNPNNTMPVGVSPNSYLCDRWSQEEMKQIPHITKNVGAALDFLSKDKDGFFLVYEQGDIDTAAHANHMDDLLGTLLDINDSVRVIMDWIQNNGGWEKNALYVTADHDHYLTLLPNFPARLAKLLIAGESHEITPERNSDKNPWEIAIQADRHVDSSKPMVEHLRDFSTWTQDDILNVGHFWGPSGSGGNGWGSHSTRPVPLYYQGDDSCIEKLKGKGYQVLGRDVAGSPDKIDHVHIHACMMKNLFGYD